MSEGRTVEEENLRIVKSSIEGYNAHDVNRAAEYEAESILQYSPLSPKGVTGRDKSISSMMTDFVAYPDVQFKVERIFGQGDWVSVQGVFSGTNTGPLVTERGRIIKASKKRISLPQAYFHRLENGKIVEIHAYWDTRLGMAQLGVLRKHVLNALVLIAFGLAFMVVQGTVFIASNPLFQVVGLIIGALPAILGATFLGRTLLYLNKAN